MESDEVFFSYQMLKCWKFGADTLETEESWVLETAGGSAIYLSQPQTPFWTPCSIESWLLVKYWALS